MNGNLTVVPEKTFGITITAKLRHGDLWELVKQFGTQSALAKELGVSQREIGQWINLQKVPNFELPRLKIVEAKLVALTGKTGEDLWPQELRDAMANPDFVPDRRIPPDRIERPCSALPSPFNTS